jgi:hypothetical protein
VCRRKSLLGKCFNTFSVSGEVWGEVRLSTSRPDDSPAALGEWRGTCWSWTPMTAPDGVPRICSMTRELDHHTVQAILAVCSTGQGVQSGPEPISSLTVLEPWTNRERCRRTPCSGRTSISAICYAVASVDGVSVSP